MESNENLFARGSLLRFRWNDVGLNVFQINTTSYLSSYRPGYYRDPHWKSMGLPEISRVTWHACDMQYLICAANHQYSEHKKLHDDVIKWKHFPRYWPFVRGIPRSPVNSPHKGQWHGASTSLICAWMNDWANNREAGDLRRHRANYDVIVMKSNHILTMNDRLPIRGYFIECLCAYIHPWPT